MQINARCSTDGRITSSEMAVVSLVSDVGSVRVVRTHCAAPNRAATTSPSNTIGKQQRAEQRRVQRSIPEISSHHNSTATALPNHRNSTKTDSNYLSTPVGLWPHGSKSSMNASPSGAVNQHAKQPRSAHGLLVSRPIDRAAEMCQGRQNQ